MIILFSKLRFLLFFNFLCFTIYAQTKFTNLFYADSGFGGRFIVKHWTSENGLPQNSVYDIDQTRDGYLWLATSFGIVRFDGMNFHDFNTENTPELPSNRISTLAADKKGGIWIGTRNGKIMYWSAGNFIDYRKTIYVNGFSVNDIELDKTGRVWIATDNNLFSYYNGKLKKYFNVNSTNKRFISVNTYNPQKILVGTSDGIYIISGNNISSIKYFGGQQINTIISDNAGAYWIGTESAFFLYKNGHIRWQSISANPVHKIRTVFSDNKKRLWVGTASDGLFVNSDYNNCEFIQKKINSRINKIFEDKSGNIWIGTFNKGLFRITDRKIFSIPLKNKKFNNIISTVIQRKNFEVWSGSFGEGIVKIKNGRKTYFTQKDGLTGNHTRIIYEDRINRLWIGDYFGGLSYWNGEKFIHAPFNSKLSSRLIYAIFQDSKNGLWVGTKNGANYIKNNKVILFSKKDGLTDNNVRAFAEAKDGTIWISTNNGITYYKNSKLFKLKLPGTNKIYNCGSMYFDKTGRLWVGSYGQGLITFYKGKVDIITKADGLFDNVILTTLEDSDGNFWLSSNLGLSRVSRADLLAHIEGKMSKVSVTTYSKDDGFLSNEFNGNINNSSCMLSDGTLLFASMDGIVAVDPSINKLKNGPKNVFIDKVVVNGKEYINKSFITISSDKNNVTFYFSAIKFYKPKSLNLNFRIKNYINNWIPLKDKRSFNLLNIPHGEYVVELKEIVNSKAPPPKIAAVKIIVRPRFYQTYWFYILLFSVGLSVIFFFVKLRFKKLEKNKVKLESLVKERTAEIVKAKEKIENANNEKSELLRIVSHNLKNPIGVILNSSEWIYHEQNDKENILELSKIIKTSAEHMLDSVKQLLQSEMVESSQFKLEISANNLIELIIQVIDNNKVSLIKKKQKLFFNSEQTQVIINCDANKIMDSLDNYIGNAIKYSGYKSEINVKVEDSENSVKVSVFDNGPGLTEHDMEKVFGKFAKLSAKPTGNESSTGLGLSIVKKLIELHGGEVGVNSEYGSGSEFFFILPKK